MVVPRHHMQRKQQKKVDDYSKKLVDNFKLIIVNPLLKLTDQEKRSITNSFGCFSQDQCIETSKNIIRNHILKRWNEKNTLHT